MTTQVYLIQCITNLHVGSGDANYGIVDKLVQRDTVYNYPTIHASSLKGALREYFEKKWVNDIDEVNAIFGKKTNNDIDAESGNCNFLNADLVALPVRCTHKQFALTLCPQNIEFVNEKTKLLTDKTIIKVPTIENKLFTNDEVSEIYLENDKTIEKANYTSLFEDNIKQLSGFNNQYAIVKNEIFDNYAKDLPVIARNRLDKNKNLWYEEVVPHQTVFITYFIPNTLMDITIFDEFEKELSKGTFQIGANSSVGYGLCKFHKLTF